MSFIRTKEIPPGSGNLYYYEVENHREGKSVRQKVIRYIGPVGGKKPVSKFSLSKLVGSSPVRKAETKESPIVTFIPKLNIKGFPDMPAQEAVWYHGTDKDFDKFSFDQLHADLGVYFTTDKDLAQFYTSEQVHGKGTPRIVQAKITPKNVFDIRYGQSNAEAVNGVFNAMEKRANILADTDSVPAMSAGERALKKLVESRKQMLSATNVDEWKSGEAKLYDAAMDIAKGEGSEKFASTVPLREELQKLGYDAIRKVDDGSDALVAFSPDIINITSNAGIPEHDLVVSPKPETKEPIKTPETKITKEVWQMSKEEAASNPGVILGGNMGNDIARYDSSGKVVLSDSFFEHSAEDRKDIWHHEITHPVVERFSMSDKVWDIMPLFGHYDEEAMKWVAKDGFRGRNIDEALTHAVQDYEDNPDKFTEKYPEQTKVIKQILTGTSPIKKPEVAPKPETKEPIKTPEAAPKHEKAEAKDKGVLVTRQYNTIAGHVVEFGIMVGDTVYVRKPTATAMDGTSPSNQGWQELDDKTKGIYKQWEGKQGKNAARASEIKSLETHWDDVIGKGKARKQEQEQGQKDYEVLQEKLKTAREKYSIKGGALKKGMIIKDEARNEDNIITAIDPDGTVYSKPVTSADEYGTTIGRGEIKGFTILAPKSETEEVVPTAQKATITPKVTNSQMSYGISVKRAIELGEDPEYPRSGAAVFHFDQLTKSEQETVITTLKESLDEAIAERRGIYADAKQRNVSVRHARIADVMNPYPEQKRQISSRIDNLKQQINDLSQRAGIEPETKEVVPGKNSEPGVVPVKKAEAHAIKEIKNRVVLPERRPNDTLVDIDVDKFDTGFSKDNDFYIGQGGTGATIGARYSMFQDYLKTGKSIDAAEVFVRPDGTVSFINGRHRYAVLRDMGMENIPVSMSAESLANAKKVGYLFGTQSVTPPVPASKPSIKYTRLPQPDIERINGLFDRLPAGVSSGIKEVRQQYVRGGDGSYKASEGLVKLNRGVGESTFYHEIGHHIYDTLAPTKYPQIIEHWSSISKNPSERFATNFAEYMTHPEKYPGLKDELDKMLGVEK